VEHRNQENPDSAAAPPMGFENESIFELANKGPEQAYSRIVQGQMRDMCKARQMDSRG
jgi:hypothetical protein